MIQKVRTLTVENIALSDTLARARVDLGTIELLRGITIQGLERHIVYLEDQLPKWYEKPQFVVSVTALATIWAVLKMVAISIS